MLIKQLTYFSQYPPFLNNSYKDYYFREPLSLLLIVLDRYFFRQCSFFLLQCDFKDPMLVVGFYCFSVYLRIKLKFSFILNEFSLLMSFTILLTNLISFLSCSNMQVIPINMHI